MKPISDFLPRLAPYVTGCPTPMMVQALLDSAVAFCENSMALRHRLDAVTQQPGWGELEMDLPAQQSVTRVLSVWADSVKLQPVATENAPALPATGTPTTYYTRRNDSQLQLLLYPAPDKACTLTVEVALRPLYSATSVEDDLFDLWLPAVIAGAKSLLMAIPDQPFSNPMLAPILADEAARRAAKARIEGSYGRSRGQFRVQMRPFA